jgi:hypothetical protein
MSSAAELFALFATLPPEQQQVLLDGAPALRPPNGTDANFENPSTGNEGTIAILTICLFITLVLGALRLYSRVFIIHILRLEDYLGFLAFLPFWGLAAIAFFIVDQDGFLVDQWNVHLGNFLDWVKYIFILRNLYAVFMMLSKTAILVEWSRIFAPNGTTRWFAWSCKLMIAINILAYLSAIIVTSLSCIPTNKIWQPWVEGSCIGRKDSDLATAWVNLFIDVAILALPQAIIWRLNMTRERKIGVSITFTVGLIVVACAAGRLHASTVINYNGNVRKGGGVNALWCLGEATGVLMVWTMAGVPKAFSKQSWLGGVISNLRSWTRIGDTTDHRSKQSGARNDWTGQTIGGSGAKVSRNTGREDTQRTNVEMDMMEKRYQQYDPEYGYGSPMGSPDAQNIGILKTTEVERRDDAASMSSREPIVDRQHPWRDQRR